MRMRVQENLWKKIICKHITKFHGQTEGKFVFIFFLNNEIFKLFQEFELSVFSCIIIITAQNRDVENVLF